MIAIITGSGGLIGSEAARLFHDRGYDVIGIDNDFRRYFFGANASTAENTLRLQRTLRNYTHFHVDIRDFSAIEAIFQKHRDEISVIIHTAAQPSHDWAAKEPLTDFGVNACGTLNLLEATRLHARKATFIFTSTNKVYGDAPNELPLVETATRWEVQMSHPFAQWGIDETMSIDQSKHSVFGASKVAADIMVQEYGRYFEMNTASFRGGCLTGPAHRSAALHGFLAYLVRCAVRREPYTILGYKGKQVRDNIHSRDLVEAFWHFVQSPRCGAVYNIGGGRRSNVSMLEAISLIESIANVKLDYKVVDVPRSGDHIWYISDTRKFEADYPDWRLNYSIEHTVQEIVDAAINDLEHGAK